MGKGVWMSKCIGDDTSTIKTKAGAPIRLAAMIKTDASIDGSFESFL